MFFLLLNFTASNLLFWFFYEFQLHCSYQVCSYIKKSLHKKWSFPLRISSVSVTKSAVFMWIWSHLLKKSFIENFIFCTVCKLIILLCSCSYSGCKTRIRQLSGRGRESVLFFLRVCGQPVVKASKAIRKKKIFCIVGKGSHTPPCLDQSPLF